MELIKKLLAVLFISTALNAAAPKIEFVILVTSYNNEKYARRNLDSLIHQRSTFPYQIIMRG